MSDTVLERQLRRLGLSADRPPDAEGWAQFLLTVTSTYAGHAQDHYLLERAMTVSSDEMRVLHDTLRRDREWLRAVIDSLDVGLIVLGADLRVELANPEATRVLAAQSGQLGDWSLDDLLRCAEQDERVHGLLQGLRDEDGPPRSGWFDGRIRGAGGAVVPVSVGVVPIRPAETATDPLPGTAMGAVVVLRDLSELHRLEVELRSAQKLEAVARLAAGLAHELNTPIQFIGDNLRFVRDCLDDVLDVADAATTGPDAGTGTGPTGGRAVDGNASDPNPGSGTPGGSTTGGPDPRDLRQEVPGALSEALDGVERVTAIVRAMKSFAHPGTTTPGPADLNQALRDTVTVAANEVRDVADVDLRLGELPAVECLVHDLTQVFLNLVVNAAHAIADRQRTCPGRGRITISTALEGDEVVVVVNDDGCGMSEEVAEHAFEPFFTTKEVGRGVGQGLALARSVVVDGHHGSITLASQPLIGTTFRIRLPVRDGCTAARLP